MGVATVRDVGLGSWPARRCYQTPGRTAVCFLGRTFTYADIDLRTRKLANALRARGVKRGDRVAYVGFNHPALLESLFAVGQLGAICVIVNARLAAPEVEYILQDSGATTVIYGTEHEEHARALTQLDVTTWVAVDPRAPEPVGEDFEDLVTSGSPDPVDEAVTWQDPCLVMYTSGTTGRPKGAVHSHGSLSMQFVSALIDCDIRSDEVNLAVAPLFHVAGLNTLTLPTFLKGGTIHIHPRFDPARVLRTIQTERVTSFFAVPVMMDALAQHADFPRTDLSSLRTVLTGGAPLPDRMIRTWADREIAVLQGFGMTETAPGIFLLNTADALRKPGSAGRPHFFVEARVVRPDGSDVSPGQHGEVIARGPNVMLGYWNRPDETARVIVDGWYHTGDLATVDEDGYAYIKDRLKDMFISGGENVYPAEVENALLNVPGVADAAVIGVPDEKWGEVGLATVVLAPGTDYTEDELRTLARDHLAGYKVPKYIRFIDKLPRTVTGKLQKHIIRAQLKGQPL